MTITYRTAGAEDATLLADLGRRAFVETFGHLYSAENLAAFQLNHSEESWREELNDPDFSVRIAEADGAPIAYSKLGPTSLPFAPLKPATEIRQFYVLKPWHGLGVAAALMDWTLVQAKLQGDHLYLSVFTDNHRAQRFYARYGFETVGRHHFMVGTHADEDLIMHLALEDQ